MKATIQSVKVEVRPLEFNLKAGEMKVQIRAEVGGKHIEEWATDTFDVCSFETVYDMLCDRARAAISTRLTLP